MALLVVVMILALVGTLVVGTLSDSGSEAASSGRIRAASRALYVADAGIEMARNRIGQNPPNLQPFNVVLDEGWNVQTRSKTDLYPQPIAAAGQGEGGDSYSINSGAGFAADVYLVNVTSTFPGGATAEIEAKIGKISAGIGGY
jgi:type II secretory pathway component PulK